MTIEIPGNFGYLDASCYAEGAPVSAALRREVIRNNNRLVSRAGIIDSCVAPSTADIDVPVGRSRGYGFADWMLIRGPIKARKKPGCNLLMCGAWFNIQASATMALQVATRARPFNPSLVVASAENVVTLPHNSGAWQNYTLQGVPGFVGDEEELTFYIRGLSTDLLDDSSYGVNTGAAETGDFKQERLYFAGAGWTSFVPYRHYVLFDDHPEIAPRFIYTRFASDELGIWPKLPDEFDPVGQTFSIYERGTWELGSILTYWMRRTR